MTQKSMRVKREELKEIYSTAEFTYDIIFYKEVMSITNDTFIP